jgi:hypothetical protein
MCLSNVKSRFRWRKTGNFLGDEGVLQAIGEAVSEIWLFLRVFAPASTVVVLWTQQSDVQKAMHDGNNVCAVNAYEFHKAPKSFTCQKRNRRNVTGE